MVASRKKYKKKLKSKIKNLFLVLFFGAVSCYLGYNLFNNILIIVDLKTEKEDLNKQIVSLQKEKETLETNILKLKDPDYIAKYVREKYFYSKDGELILRMDD